MNRRDNNISLQELLDLIEQYFDCALSDTDERRLRNIVAHTPLSHPAIDEARALMGFRHNSTTVKTAAPQRWQAISSVAVAAFAIITIGAIIFVGNKWNSNENRCFAYVNGIQITNEEDVIRQLTANLREFNEAVEMSNNQLLNDLGDIAPIIDNYDSSQIPEI